jgi:transposase
MAYSMDLRLKALEAIDERRGSTAEVARIFGVTTQWLNGLLRRRRATGGVAFSTTKRGRKPSIDPDRLRAAIAANPDGTIEDFRAAVAPDRHPTAVWRAARKLGKTFKKSRSRRTSGTGRTSPPPAPRGRDASRGRAGNADGTGSSSG